jgi:hypothetical protein
MELNEMIVRQVPVIFVIALATSGCVPQPSVRVTKMGKRLEPLSDDCKVEFKSMDMQQMALDYETVGVLMLRVSGAGPTPKQRDALRRAACRLGSTVLVPGMQAGDHATYSVLGAKRKKPLLGSGSDSTPKDPPKAKVLAVFDLEDRESSLAKADAEKLADYLATKLAEHKSYRTIPRAQLRKRLVKQRKQSYRACYDSSCQIELGKALAASAVVSSRLLRIGKTCTLTVKIFDLRSEATLAAASAKGSCQAADLQRAIDRISTRFATD